MTTVGFVGSGSIGSTIAQLAVAAGHQVEHLLSLPRPAGAADRSYLLMRRVICLRAQAPEVEE